MPPGGWWRIAARGRRRLAARWARGRARPRCCRPARRRRAWVRGSGRARARTRPRRRGHPPVRPGGSGKGRPPLSCWGEPRVRETSMQVLHVALTAFGHDGLFGGGERYPLELARPWSWRRAASSSRSGGRRVSRSTTGCGSTFCAPCATSAAPGHLSAPALAGVVRRADVVHAHHLRSLPSRISGLGSRPTHPRGRHRPRPRRR